MGLKPLAGLIQLRDCRDRRTKYVRGEARETLQGNLRIHIPGVS